jgi:squalene-hopene/tetraprenyl-beta-curcumene cyclase
MQRKATFTAIELGVVVAVIALASCCMSGPPAAVKRQAEGGQAAAWDSKAAAAYLDQRTTGWMQHMGAIDHGTFCISCHTGLPYALARSALRANLGERGVSPTEQQMLDSVTKRVRLWKEVQPFLSGPTESRGTESVLNALILITYGAHTTPLSADTHQALDTLWERQLKTGENAGAWPWFSLGNEPWEAPDSQYWGATLAAATLGTLPQQYRSEPEIQANLTLLQGYLLRGEHAQSLHNRLSLLWASTRLPGLLSPDQQRSIVHEVLSRQHPDGGWSASDFIGPTWRRNDGTPQETRSDGYGTGLAAFVIEQTGMPSTRSATKAARLWLTRNQDRTSGSWPAYSLNKKRDPASDVGKFMSDAATAYSVLALTSGN